MYKIVISLFSLLIVLHINCITLNKLNHRLSNIGQTPSVTTFGYDHLRSGKGKSLISPPLNKYLKIKHLQFIQGRLANKTMPLYINGFLEGKEVFPKKRVIIFSHKNTLKAVDIDKDQIIWKTQVPGNIIESTPVIDMKTKSLYVLSQSKERSYEKVYILHHKLLLIDLNGTIKNEIYIDLSHFLKSKVLKQVLSKRNYKNVPRIDCKTALGINKVGPVPYVFFGCSIDTEPVKGRQYGSQKGIHGVVIAVDLNRDGTFTKKTRAFLTSQVASPPSPKFMTGFDTGIYNTGSGASVLPDGDLLIATGNGPVFPEQNNFGCSIVRIDGTTLKVKKNKNGELFTFSMNIPPFNECWYLNLEYASSAVASVIKNRTIFSTIIDKNGHLTAFNPDDFIQGHRTKVLIGGEPSYGQPVLFINNQNQVNVFSVSQSYTKIHFNQKFLVDEEQTKKISHIIKKECFGYLAKEKQKNMKAFYLMYSGRMRDVYANSIENTYIYKNLTSFFSPLFGLPEKLSAKKGLWGPFVAIQTLGYIPDRNFKLEKVLRTQFQLRSMPLFLNLNRINELLHINKREHSLRSDHFYIKSKSKDNQKCSHQETNQMLKPLYKITRKGTYGLNQKGLYAHSFLVQSDYSLQKVWHFNDEKLLPSISNPVLSVSINKEPVLIVTATDNNQGEQQNKQVNKTNKTYLLLLNGETGQLIGKTDFFGEVHFSMPLVVDDLIFIATRNHGIKMFAVR